jgi:hypothetical protein
MASIYNYVSFSAARQELANRLYDSLKQFWSDTELKSLLLEALRTWNAMTSYWKNDFTFSSQQNVMWYDLTDAINLPNTLRPFTIGVGIYPDIQFALLEPATGIFWPGVSTQFTADDLINAVSRRQDEILSITGCTTTRRLIPAVNGRITLPDTVIDVRRIAYLPASGSSSNLYGVGLYGAGLYPLPVIGLPSTMWPSDAWDQESFVPLYLQNAAGTPLTYLLSVQPPISFDVDRAPGFSGSYELLTVESASGQALGTNTYGSGFYGAGLYGGGAFVSIPDDWFHLVKWGALADMLSRDANAADPLRAQYCEMRYRMGLRLLSIAPALLAIRNNNMLLQIDSVRNADLFNPSWEGAAPGNPSIVYHSGLNLIAVLPPPPNTGPYVLTATVVQNAPVPVLDSDFIQMAREDYDAILDYSEHIALFKSGGAEFTDSMPLLKRFLSQAQLYNAKLSEMGEYTSVLYNLSQLQEETAPRMAPAGEGGGGS